ncbi:uncharacterized protein LOC143444238 isoform X2 [Clavelina lepadiformis]|uniref:uncharacterized protein LOC143444238 isoform X2 n=1 Tax=Clavelina lepadiformis TaxID=159417 RepID=UPI004041614F
MPQKGGDDYKTEALQRAARERKDIVGKYEKGEDSDEEEDQWLDARAKVYRVTDRYGFLHEEELSEIPSFEEERRKHTEVKRQLKWLKMLQKWINYVGTEKLRTRVYKGIPLGLRGDAWKLLLNVAGLKENKPNMYEEMKQRSQAQSPDIKQIDMDVNRTYRNHIMFRKRYSIKQQQLFYVLAAYSMYNTEVGYCQGMSQIAALLLMFMSEEEAFWGLHSLLYGEKHRMHGFFIPGFPKLMRFQEHHDKILKKYMPRLKKHLDRNEIFASLYTMKWFFQCFLDRAPFPLTLRLWDIYMLEGEKLLTVMSYTTLKIHKAMIKKMDMDEIVSFLQERLAVSFGFDDDNVVEQLKLSMTELKRGRMDLPPPGGQEEEPKLPFGVEIKPTFEQETGIRSPALKNSLSKKSEKMQKRGKVAMDLNGAVPRSSEYISSSTDVPKSPNSTDDNAASNSNKERKLSKKQSQRETDRTDTASSSANEHRNRKSKKSSKKEKKSKEKNKADEASHKGSMKNSVNDEENTVHDSHTNNTVKNQPKENIRHETNIKFSELSSSHVLPIAAHVDTSSKKSSVKSEKPPSPRKSASRRPAWLEPMTNATSTEYTSSVESSQPFTGSPVETTSADNENTKVKFVWKTPSPTKTPSSMDHFSYNNVNKMPNVASLPSSSHQTFHPVKHHQLLAETDLIDDSNTYHKSARRSKDFDKQPASKRRGSDGHKGKSHLKLNKVEASDPFSYDNLEQRENKRSRAGPRALSRGLDQVQYPTYSQNGCKARPVSLYDNVKQDITDSEDGLDGVTSSPLLTKTSEADTDSIFEAKMEESLENLRELAAGLSHTPSPRFPEKSQHFSSPVQPISPVSVTALLNVGLQKRDYSSRSKSLELDDDDDDLTALSALDDTARSLSRSVEILQEKDKRSSVSNQNMSQTSTFRKAVEGAGLATQLPKRPSSTALNSALSANRFELASQTRDPRSTSSNSNSAFAYRLDDPVAGKMGFNNGMLLSEFTRRQDLLNANRSSNKWGESNLDMPPTSYELLHTQRLEAQPVIADFGENDRRNMNNNSSFNAAHRFQPTVQHNHDPANVRHKTSKHGGGNSNAVPTQPTDSKRLDQKRKGNYYSRHDVAPIDGRSKSSYATQPWRGMEVIRYDEHVVPNSTSLGYHAGYHPQTSRTSAEDRFADITSISPENSPPQPPTLHIGSSRTRYSHSSDSHHTGPRYDNLHTFHRVEAPPHPGMTCSHHYVMPDSDAVPAVETNSFWSRARRKNSSSVTIKTEHPYNALNDSVV